MRDAVQGLRGSIATRPLDVSKARFILIALICTSPAILLWGGLITQGLVAGIAAAGLVTTARELRQGEAEFLVSIIRPLTVAAAVPALWIAIQVFPLRAAAHPIWRSAETALGHPLAGAISIDLGASVVALGQYLSMAAVAFLSAAVAIDRHRAESILFVLTGAGATIALVTLAHDLFFASAAFDKAQASDCVALGAIAASAACIRTIERYRTRHSSPQRSAAILLRTFAACSAALAACLAALVFDGTYQMLITTGCGVAAVVCVFVIRQFGLGAWGTTPIVMSVIGVAVFLIITTQPVDRGSSLLLAYAASPSAISKPMLEDAPLVGTGAGTVAAMAPIYREMNDPPFSAAASTAAATIAIELGQPMLWLIVAAAVCSIAILLKASLQRGRDSFYPATGGGCLITLLLQAFINAGLLGIAASLIAAAAIGLAFAQRKSRTVQQ